MVFKNEIECDVCSKKWHINDVTNFNDFYYGALYTGNGCPSCTKEGIKLKQLSLLEVC